MSRSALLAGAAAFFAGITSLAAAPLHVNNVWIERDRWLLPDWESLTESDDDAIVANLDLIATVSRTLAGGGISLYVAPIPFKARFCQHDLPAGAVSPSVQRRYARSIGWMNDRGVRAVDLAAGFRSLGQAPYYRTDQHWTSPAAESAGAAIATAVGGADAGPPASSRAFVAERLGDLTMLLPPERRATIGPERFVLRTPYDADLAGYDVRTGAVGAPDASARVHVAGSSFVRPMWGLPQAVSRALGSPVDVTFLSGNAGPYQALLMALRAVATWPRPASVVWQLGEAYLFAGPDASNVWLDDALMAPRSFLDQVARLVA